MSLAYHFITNRIYLEFVLHTYPFRYNFINIYIDIYI